MGGKVQQHWATGMVSFTSDKGSGMLRQKRVKKKNEGKNRAGFKKG